MGFPALVVPTTTRPKDAEPIELVRGDTWRYPFQVVDRETNAAIDVTGWTFWFTAKYSVVEPDAQAGIAQDNIMGGKGGVVLLSPTQGQCLVTVQPIVTRAFPDGPVRMVYDIQSMDPGGVVITIERGEQVVLPDVTRAIS